MRYLSVATVNIHEAKSQLSKLISQALNGQEVIIAKGGTPVVKLTPVSNTLLSRQGGQFKGMLNMADDFDAPLSKDILDDFYKKDL